MRNSFASFYILWPKLIQEDRFFVQSVNIPKQNYAFMGLFISISFQMVYKFVS